VKISTIILTYNRPEALELVLKSIINQSIKPDEVIVADDGSGSKTSDIITKFHKNFPVTLKHVWHEDKGFRIAAIRNKAIKESTGDYIIFSDGDLVFHSHFFKDFKQNLCQGKAFIGSRVFLSKQYSQQIQMQSNFTGRVSFLSDKIEKNRLNSIRLPFINKMMPDTNFSPKLRGGLLAVSKKDITQVNGWNEDFTGWGKEDTELLSRMHQIGIKFKKLKFTGITYHLWHPYERRSNVNKNEALLIQSMTKQITWCDNGLVKGDRI